MKKIPDYHNRNVKFNVKAPLRHITAQTVHERLQVDLIDFTKTKIVYKKKSYQYILSVIDCFSRFVWLRPLPNKMASTVARLIYSILQEFGNPSIIQTDQRTEFKGKFKQLLQKKKISPPDYVTLQR